MSKVIAVAGKDLLIKCPVGGYPIEIITWEKDGKLLPLDMRHKVLPGGTLRIQNVNKMTDSGRSLVITDKTILFLKQERLLNLLTQELYQ